MRVEIRTEATEPGIKPGESKNADSNSSVEEFH